MDSKWVQNHPFTQNDYVWGDVHDIAGLPGVLIERLQHYFATYKLVPGEPSRIRLEGVYGPQQARSVVQAAMEDYRERFPLTQA